MTRSCSLVSSALLLTVCLIALAGCQAGAQSDSAQSGSASPDRAEAVPGELPTPYPDRIALTWSEDPATSLSVTWRTDLSVDAAVAQVALAKAEPSFYTEAETVEASTELLDLSEIEDEHVTAHYHSATFSGLQPDTLYAYRVGDGERWSEWFHARTAADTPEPMSFIYFGDAQNNLRSHWSRAIRAAYQHAPDVRFMVHAGDLVNGAHRNVEWGEWHQAGGFLQAMLPSVPVPGNHEYESTSSETVIDTFAVVAEHMAGAMQGMVMSSTPRLPMATFSAERENTSGDPADIAGTWRFTAAGTEGQLTITGSTPSYNGRLVGPDDTELPVTSVTTSGDSVTVEFLMEVDADPSELSRHWRPGFTLPLNGPAGLEESTYYIDIQGVRIIGLNSPAALGSPQALQEQTEWLRRVLEENPSKWTVATFHHPIFSSSEGRDNPATRAAWKPLFDEHRVDLVLQGHDHTYARGRAKNLTRGVNTRSPVGGTVYVNSVSGAKMYELKPDEWDGYEPVDLARSAENTQLFQVIRVDGDTLHFRAYTVTGELYDAFELVKEAPDAPSRFNALIDPDAAAHTHDNTIPYERP